ncbi:hypothetical protein PR048_025394 [Dryococelus australis]|uniref:Uncharacterized protein n=1 Tax=Dryococelus australis TaxID=614101 RepID=A0ABQ9GR68_9NEOP|nr:hypothetical protein PR048_025394 [Dryococelus australis]
MRKTRGCRDEMPARMFSVLVAWRMACFALSFPFAVTATVVILFMEGSPRGLMAPVHQSLQPLNTENTSLGTKPFEITSVFSSSLPPGATQNSYLIGAFFSWRHRALGLSRQVTNFSELYLSIRIRPTPVSTTSCSDLKLVCALPETLRPSGITKIKFAMRFPPGLFYDFLVRMLHGVFGLDLGGFNSEVLRADEVWSSVGMKGWRKREIPEKTRRPTLSRGTINTCEIPVTRPGIEPGSPWWEASGLTARPPRPHEVFRKTIKCVIPEMIYLQVLLKKCKDTVNERGLDESGVDPVNQRSSTTSTVSFVSPGSRQPREPSHDFSSTRSKQPFKMWLDSPRGDHPPPPSFILRLHETSARAKHQLSPRGQGVGGRDQPITPPAPWQQHLPNYCSCLTMHVTRLSPGCSNNYPELATMYLDNTDVREHFCTTPHISKVESRTIEKVRSRFETRKVFNQQGGLKVPSQGEQIRRDSDHCRRWLLLTSRYLERNLHVNGAAASWVRFLAESLPDFRMWETCRAMPLVGSPIPPLFHFGAAPYSLIASPSSAVKTTVLKASKISSLTHFIAEILKPMTAQDSVCSFRSFQFLANDNADRLKITEPCISLARAFRPPFPVSVSARTCSVSSPAELHRTSSDDLCRAHLEIFLWSHASSQDAGWRNLLWGNGKIPRKLADQWHRSARFPRAKIRGRLRWGIDPSSPRWEASSLTTTPLRAGNARQQHRVHC